MKLTRLVLETLLFTQSSTWTVDKMFKKLTEELGEFSETVAIAQGDKPHKQLDHEAHVFEELADVLQNLFSIVGKLYPDMPMEEVLHHLTTQWAEKNQVWKARYIDKQTVPEGDLKIGEMFIISGGINE